MKKITNDDNRARDIQERFATLGYELTATAVIGTEKEYWDEMMAALTKTEEALKWLNKEFGCKGTSKRALRILHERYPEPDWGIRPRITYDTQPASR